MKDNTSTNKIMADVIIALLPALIFGVYNFGLNALILVLVSVLASVIGELICGFVFRRGLTLKDLSSVVTGLIFGLLMPPYIPYWIPAIGAGFATIIVKHVFGGIGRNYVNPAATSKAIMMFVLTGYMTSFVYNGVTTPAPLIVAEGGGKIDLLQMFIGNTAGTIGETSALALLVGAIYLFIRKVINWRIPVVIILTVAVYITIYTMVARGGFDGEYVLAHILSGGLLLGACFMATEYTTSPTTPLGQVIYAIVIGVVICSFRLFYDNLGAVVYGIVVGNLATIVINLITVPVSFGKGGRRKAKEAEIAKEEEALEIAKEREEFEKLKAEIIENQRANLEK